MIPAPRSLPPTPGPQGPEEIAALSTKAAAAANDLGRAITAMHPPEPVAVALSRAYATLDAFSKASHAKGRSLQYQVDAWYKDRDTLKR